MYGFGGVGLSEVQISISELSVVGGWWVGGWWTRQTHFMVGPGRGPTKNYLGLSTVRKVASRTGGGRGDGLNPKERGRREVTIHIALLVQ